MNCVRLIRCCALALLFGMTIQSRTQDRTAPATVSSDEEKALLTSAFERNTLAYVPGPYHLLAKFETFSADGQPTGDGTIEKYFAAPGHLKIITRFGGHTMTAYYAGGAPRYTDDGFIGSILQYYANDFLFNPALPPQGIQNRDLKTKVMTLQGRTLDCGSFQFFILPPGFPPAQMETYCVTADTHDLTLRQTERFSIRYSEFVPFLGKSIAQTISASKGSQVRCRIHIEKLDEEKLDEAAMLPPPNASPVDPGPEMWSTVPGQVAIIGGNKLPEHQQDRASHYGSFNLFHVLVSCEGKTLDIEPQYSTSPELEKTAEDIVKTWVYKPVLRDGKPVELITTVKYTVRY
jgi:hypothetical protein